MSQLEHYSNTYCQLSRSYKMLVKFFSCGLVMTACSVASQRMALVNLAVFMGQAMRETIIYDACNRNNWDKWYSADIPKTPNSPAKYLPLLRWVLAVGSWDKIMLNMIAKMRVPKTTLLWPKVKVWGWSRILESPTEMSKWCMWRGTISLWGRRQNLCQHGLCRRPR